LQKIAGTIVWATRLAVVIDTVGEARIRKYVGYIGIALTLGTFMGLMLGGVVIARAGNNADFVMSYGLVSIDILSHMVMIERGVARTLDRDGILIVSTDKDVEMFASFIRFERKTSVSIATTAGEALEPSTSPKYSWKRRQYYSHLELSEMGNASRRHFFYSHDDFRQLFSSIYSGFQAVLPLALHRMFG